MEPAASASALPGCDTITSTIPGEGKSLSGASHFPSSPRPGGGWGRCHFFLWAWGSGGQGSELLVSSLPCSLAPCGEEVSQPQVCGRTAFCMDTSSFPTSVSPPGLSHHAPVACCPSPHISSPPPAPAPPLPTPTPTSAEGVLSFVLGNPAPHVLVKYIWASLCPTFASSALEEIKDRNEGVWAPTPHVAGAHPAGCPCPAPCLCGSASPSKQSWAPELEKGGGWRLLSSQTPRQ